MSDSTRNAEPMIFEDLDPEPRLLMGPGPVDVYPRVLQAMSRTMLGQFDPQFTTYMNQVMDLYRQVFRTDNHWTFLVNGTARAGIEACLTSLISPGDKVLVPIFGRFGHLLTEIAGRSGGDVVTIETEWGSVFEQDQITDAYKPAARRSSHWSMAILPQPWPSRSLRWAVFAGRPVCWSMPTARQHWVATRLRLTSGVSMPPPPGYKSVCRAHRAPLL